MKYEELEIGAEVRVSDCKDLIGEELTFAQLVREPSTSKLLVDFGAHLGEELTDDMTLHVAQILKVVDYDPEEDTDPDDIEWATVMLDVPGWSSSPVQIEYEDMEEPEIDEGDDPKAGWNSYRRIWRVKKALQPLEHLALGASIYSKCKSNYIDSTEELLQAFQSGLIKTVFNGSQITQIRTVLKNAHIDIPDGAAPEPVKEEPATQTAIVAAAPAEIGDPLAAAKALHQRILTDAKIAAESLWDLCTAIKEMRDGKHYKALLYGNFEDYCSDALGMSRAQAYRYITIAEGMTSGDVQQMQQIGTTKLALLASVTEADREIVSTAVDVESATVKELKAQIDALKNRAAKAEQEKLSAEQMRLVESGKLKELDKAYERAQSRIATLEAQKQDLGEKDGQIKRLRAEIANNSDYIGKLQQKITDLENRPVEVAVQTDEAALEQLRKEYEAKLREYSDSMDKLEEELADAQEDAQYREVMAMCNNAYVVVNSLCNRLKAIPNGKAKESLVKKAKEICLQIGQL